MLISQTLFNRGIEGGAVIVLYFASADATRSLSLLLKLLKGVRI